MDKKRDEVWEFSKCNLLYKNRKGLSTIVVTLIIVLLSMVAIGVVWVVVNGLIQSGTQGIEINAKCLNINLEVKQVNCADGTTNQVCNVTLSRTGAETDDIGGVKIVFIDRADGISSSSLIDSAGNIEPLIGRRILNLDTLVPNDNTVSRIEVTPYFTDDSGNQQLCSQTASLNF
jgi:hypothetical protein